MLPSSPSDVEIDEKSTVVNKLDANKIQQLEETLASGSDHSQLQKPAEKVPFWSSGAFKDKVGQILAHIFIANFLYFLSDEIP